MKVFKFVLGIVLILLGLYVVVLDARQKFNFNEAIFGTVVGIVGGFLIDSAYVINMLKELGGVISGLLRGGNRPSGS